MSIPIALQLFSVRDAMAADPKGTLKKVKEMGYDGVETCGHYGMTPQEYRSYCDDIGLKIMSAHGGVDFVSDQNGHEYDDYVPLGLEYMAIAWMGTDDIPGGVNHEAACEKVRVGIEKAKKYGIQILYHNHEYEFSKYKDANILTYIFKDSSKELQYEPDVCWISAGGEDPAEYIKNFIAHSPVIHMKDYRYDGEYEVNYEKVSRPEGWVPVPVGSGKLDVPSIMKVAEEIGTKWIVVEQDNPVDGLSELECAESSIKWFRNAGY